MKNPANNYRFAALAIEEDVPSLFNAAAARFECVARSANHWRPGDLLSAFLNLSDITKGLIGSPLLNCVS